jgi:di/tricarboxylate transporter
LGGAAIGVRGVTGEQIFLFGLLGALFAMLVWGRIRYDLVAFGALIIAVLGGAVNASEAFAGFGNDAVVIVALVLIVSRSLVSAGSVELIAGAVLVAGRAVSVHIAVMSVIGAALSAVINNVAALVMLMNLDIEAARKAKRPVALTLMPLSFATILGGMITMIGTPPNVVVAQIRERALGEPFRMFDFAPVGLACAIVGIAFVATVGWRLIASRAGTVREEPEAKERFVAEAQVPEGSKAIDMTVAQLYEIGDEHDVTVLGLVRDDRRLPGFAASETIRKGDLLVIEGGPKSLEAFIGAASLDAFGEDRHGGMTGQTLTLVEAIVTEGSRINGRTADSLRLQYRRGVTLIGISRQGRRIRARVRRTTVRPGDVVLLLGPPARVAQVAEWLGVLPLEDRTHTVVKRDKALLSIGIFAAAIVATVAGFVTLPIALGAAVGLYALLSIISPREVYESVEWPVIVLLASLIPIGIALEQSGGTLLIAGLIVEASASLPAWAVLAIIIAVTMTMSDFLNNVATALIAAPISIEVANKLDVSPDPFLMGVAVAASCAFLTPIGHQNNTIIMGPGGYRFSDYWRMGLPLEIIIVAVAVPTILFVWPL